MFEFDSFTPQHESQTEESVVVEKQKAIVLYNDDVNTFDFVIETLVEVCNHEPLQAEQCAYIIHYKGKCVVKNGSFDDLKPLCEQLLDKGLSAKIEE